MSQNTSASSTARALDDAALNDLLDLLYDDFCGRRISEFVDPERVLRVADAALAPANVAYWHGRLAVPLRSRLLARFAQSTTKVAAWLPDPVVREIGNVLGQPMRIPPEILDEIVTSERVRETVKTLLQESLSSFVAKGGIAGSDAGAVKNALGWGARAVGAMGRGLLSGLGEEIEKQVQVRIREFVDSSVSAIQVRIRDGLASEEGARALGQERRHWFSLWLKSGEGGVASQIAKFPFARLDPLAPDLVAHNLARESVRAIMIDELRAVLDELSKETIGESLARAGLTDVTRDAFKSHALPAAQQFVQSSAFVAWWSRHAKTC